jgi:Flp pilus assembly pilin Flp
MVALIAAVIITTVAVVGRQTDGAFNEVSTNLATEGGITDPGATP